VPHPPPQGWWVASHRQRGWAPETAWAVLQPTARHHHRGRPGRKRGATGRL